MKSQVAACFGIIICLLVCISICVEGKKAIRCGYKEKLEDGKCLPCPICPAGQGLTGSCGYGKGAGLKCEACLAGQFRSNLKYEKCVTCLNCTEYYRHFKYQCRQVVNAECGGCLPNYYNAWRDSKDEKLRQLPCAHCSTKPNDVECAESTVLPDEENKAVHGQQLEGTNLALVIVACVCATLIIALVAVVVYLVKKKQRRSLKQDETGANTSLLTTDSESPVLNSKGPTDIFKYTNEEHSVKSNLEVVLDEKKEKKSDNNNGKIGEADCLSCCSEGSEMLTTKNTSCQTSAQNICNDGHQKQASVVAVGPQLNTGPKLPQTESAFKSFESGPGDAQVGHWISGTESFHCNGNGVKDKPDGIKFTLKKRQSFNRSISEPCGVKTVEEVDLIDLSSNSGENHKVVQPPSSSAQTSDHQQQAACSISGARQPGQVAMNIPEVGETVENNGGPVSTRDGTLVSDQTGISEASTVLIRGLEPRESIDCSSLAAEPTLCIRDVPAEQPLTARDTTSQGPVDGQPMELSQESRAPEATAIQEESASQTCLKHPRVGSQEPWHIHQGAYPRVALTAVCNPGEPDVRASVTRAQPNQTLPDAEQAERDAEEKERKKRYVDEKRYALAVQVAAGKDLEDIDYSLQEEMSLLLNVKKIAGDKNYIHVALHLGLREDVIHNLHGMMEVFKLLKMKRVTIAELLKAVKHVKRLDVVNILTEWVLERFCHQGTPIDMETRFPVQETIK